MTRATEFKFNLEPNKGYTSQVPVNTALAAANINQATADLP